MDESHSWWSLTLETLPDSREVLEAVLAAAGCSGIWEREETATSRGRVRLTVYFPGPAPAALEFLEWWPRAAGLVVGNPEIETVENRDWFRVWRENFAPTALTAETLVIPAWMEPDPGEKRLVLKIYPGLGFGTGTHETTRLAASLIEAEIAEKSDRSAGIENLLDIGTGSGILAILAARRGIGRVTALDIDRDALDNARENLAHNGVGQKVELSLQPLKEINEKYDLVVANIVAPVLRELAPQFSRLLQPAGCLILSGMLHDQAEEIAQLLSTMGLACGPRRDLGEWAAFTCRKCMPR